MIYDLRFYKVPLLAFFCLFQMAVLGQMEQGKRIEFEHNLSDEEEFQVFPLGANGLLMMNSKINFLKKNLVLNFSKYDTTLTQSWHSTFLPDDRYELVRTYDNGRQLYLFFREESTVNISIFRLDFESGDKSVTEGKLPVNMDIDQFMVMKSKAIIGGKFNDRPVVVTFSFFDSSTKVLPGLHANQLIINELDIDEQSENIYIMLKNERTCQFILKTFSYDAKPISSLNLGERSHSPITGKILHINNEIVLAGTYSDACSILSEGIYLHRLDQEKTQFINFADLKNFFKYLKPKREQRVMQKIDLKKKQGKAVKLRYRLLLHNIISQQDGFLLVAEIFYPEYKSPSNNVFNSFRTYRVGGDVYNNFRYSHAIICKFDKNGTLLWDNCFPLDNLESPELNEKTQITVDNDILVMAYPKEGLIKTEEIRGGQTTKSIENFKLKPLTEEEKITVSDKPYLVAWYDRNFLAYGFQTVKNTKNSLLSHEVFYLNKLSYLPKE